MFKKINQVDVESTEGFKVEFSGRIHLIYSEGESKIIFETEVRWLAANKSTTTIYVPKKLRKRTVEEVEVGEEKKLEVLERIHKALEFMKINHEFEHVD